MSTIFMSVSEFGLNHRTHRPVNLGYTYMYCPKTYPPLASPHKRVTYIRVLHPRPMVMTQTIWFNAPDIPRGARVGVRRLGARSGVGGCIAIESQSLPVCDCDSVSIVSLRLSLSLIWIAIESHLRSRCDRVSVALISFGGRLVWRCAPSWLGDSRGCVCAPVRSRLGFAPMISVGLPVARGGRGGWAFPARTGPGAARFGPALGFGLR